MDTALWVVQGLLAFAFVMAGAMKIMQPKAKLKENMDWVEDFSETQVKGIGVLEVLGAVGIILPMLLGVLEILTPLAALGLALVVLGAIVTHIRRNEMPMIAPPVVLLALSAFVVFGRLINEATKVT